MKDAVVMKLDNATRMLAEAKTIQQAKKIMDMADAAKVYARQQQLGQDATDYADSIKIEAMRRLGQLWKDAPKHPGTRVSPLLGGSQEKPPSRLSELGINKKLAHLSTKLAELPKEEYEQVRDGIVGMAEALRQAKYKKIREELPEPDKATLCEEGPYDLVLADPPWRYEHQQAGNRRVENHYPTATVEEIEKHAPNCSEDAILFLWATTPLLKEALQIMEAWGFQYKTSAVWDKETIGMGYWFRGQHELLLVGTKGSPGTTPEPHRVSSVFREKRTAHSRKPVCVYEWIEKAFPRLVKLEMYCRSPRKGWAAWGNQV